MESISVAIVDDEELIVSLLSTYLSQQTGLVIWGLANSGEDFLLLLSTQDSKPDVVVLDLKMKGQDGIQITSILKSLYPNIQVIVMSSYYKRSFLGFMLKTGVSAFIPKEVASDQLVDIIREVHTKGYYFQSDQMEIIRDQISSKSPRLELESKHAFSSRELEVLQLICQQKTAKEIGEILFISPKTVEGHKNSLFLKTEAHNVVGLVIYAFKNNLIPLDEIPLSPLVKY